MDIKNSLKGAMLEAAQKVSPQLSPPMALPLPSDPPPKGKSTKKALVIGIDYVGTPNELQGCVKDAVNMAHFLSRAGYHTIHMLVDRSMPDSVAADVVAVPTYRNIVAGLRWLYDNAAPGDSLFLHYSGHGTHVADQNGDEEDGEDEALVPLDSDAAGLLLDDELQQILCEFPLTGVRLRCVLDCCHSGTAMDMKLPKGLQCHKDADIIVLSGCKDTQTSADTQRGGALTCAFLDTLASSRTRLNVGQLIVGINSRLKESGFIQIPVLTNQNGDRWSTFATMQFDI
jgi:hypothetical protein